MFLQYAPSYKNCYALFLFSKPLTVDPHFINAMLDFFFFQMVELQSLWAKQTAVVVFLRRFGWPLCRLWSTELSSVKPQLDAHGVRLCGVGLEEFGVEEFQEGKFFTGGLKACCKTLIINIIIIIIIIIIIAIKLNLCKSVGLQVKSRIIIIWNTRYELDK